MMEQTSINWKEEISSVTPEPMRSFLVVDGLPFPRSYECIVRAFREAAEEINPVVSIGHRFGVIFSKAPFVLNLANSKFTYEPKRREIINFHVENTILLDCEKMMRYPFPIQVACILEELVHVLMNVSDESFVTEVVGLLYQGVSIVEGKYSPRS